MRVLVQIPIEVSTTPTEAISEIDKMFPQDGVEIVSDENTATLAYWFKELRRNRSPNGTR